MQSAGRFGPAGSLGLGELSVGIDLILEPLVEGSSGGLRVDGRIVPACGRQAAHAATLSPLLWGEGHCGSNTFRS